MSNDTNLQFIREKISHLRNAVMYVSCNSPVKFGNDIVTAVRVDEEGQLWFVTNSPAQLVEQCEQCFPARLRFYKKGVHFFIEVSGKATVVNSLHSVRHINSGKNDEPKSSGKVLMKMAMKNIEYTEPHAKKPKSKIELLMEGWYNWFLHTASVQHDTGPVLQKLRQTN
jgi:general stress protein 26